MPRVGSGLWPAILVVLIAFGIGLPGRAAPPAPLDGLIIQLDSLRHQCVSTALSVQQRERTIGALDLAIGVMARGVDAKDKEIAQGRQQQEALLGALQRLARAPPEALAFAPEGPVDRQRSAILIAATVPALTAQGKELAGQLAALATVRRQIEARRKDVDEARAALAKGRDALAQLLTRRNALLGQLLPNDRKPAPTAQLGEQASDLFDLIKRADAANDQRDKELMGRLKALQPGAGKTAPPPTDPTRPKSLRAVDALRADMVWAVSGELVHRFGEADRYGRPGHGLTLQAPPNGVVAAPFDGQVAYAGPFRGYGLILIIRHGGGYHSLLTGLGRVDVTAGQWLLAGEPVGYLPEAADRSASVTFYLELRREGRPVDPQSRLSSRDQKTEDTRVRE